MSFENKEFMINGVQCYDKVMIGLRPHFKNVEKEKSKEEEKDPVYKVPVDKIYL